MSMANPNAVFGTIAELSREAAAVVLEGGRDVRFDRTDRRVTAFLNVLEDLQRRKMPVYIELDPGSGFITRVRLPKLVRVQRITEEADGDVSVMFEQSHERHVVKRDSPDAGELLRVLREARKDQWLAVTVSDAAEILDVRPFDPPFDLHHLEPPPAIRWWHWSWWPWNWCCVSMARAQQLFDLCAATTCDPMTVPVPCIPFLFPDDGCWGRAHEMSRLMIEDGTQPRKVWIDGTLTVQTRNNPNCFVRWGWHVAPTLCVRRGRWWWFSSQRMVIDPALFTTPVTEATWKGVQGDPSATLTPTSYIVFSRWNGTYQTDRFYVKTNEVLADFRAQLQLRSLNDGPPPYAGCP
jgi:hypothetical protein